MRVIVINPKTKTVEEAQLVGDDGEARYRSLKALMGDVWLEGVGVARNEVMYVDEEFLLKPEARTTTDWFVVRPHGPIVGHPQPMCGIAVMTGVDDEGETCATRLTLEQVHASVKFVRARFDGFSVRTGETELMGRPAALIQQRARFSPLGDEEEGS